MKCFLSKKENSGVSWFLILGIALLLLTVILMGILSYSRIYASLNNLKNKVKLELNNTSAAAAEMIYKDLAEQNFDSYLESFRNHENTIRNDFMKRLKKDMYFKTSIYEIEPDSVSLTFEAKDGYVNYIFECHVKIKMNILDENRTLVSQNVKISAKHFYKGIENSDNFNDYTYTPSEKDEHNVGGGTP